MLGSGPADGRGPIARQFLTSETLSASLELERPPESLLPYPLTATSSKVIFKFGIWNDKDVGHHRGAGLYIPARLGNLEGAYLATMFVDADRSLIVGRERFGEPKFMGVTRGSIYSDSFAMSVSRHPVCWSLHGRLSSEPWSGYGVRRTFTLKAHLDMDACRTVGEPVLMATEWGLDETSGRTGSGVLRLAGAASDVFSSFNDADIDVPVTLSEGPMKGVARVVAKVDERTAVSFLNERLGLD